MSKDHVRQRIQANSLNVADGLEKLQEELLALFNSHLDKYREETLKREEVYKAMLVDLTRQVGELRRQGDETRAGIEGLSVQIAEMVNGRP